MKQTFLLGLLLLTACVSSQEMNPVPSAFSQDIATRTPPPTQAATNTTIFVPPPTLTPTVPPPKRYFTEEFNNSLAYWSTVFALGDTNTVDIRAESSTLTFELSSPNTWLYTIYGAFEYESVHIEILVENRGSDINAIGLVCHYDGQEGWYEFNISSDGVYNVLYGQWLDNGIAQFTPILNDTSGRMNSGSTVAVNKVGLDCYENTLHLYINEKLIRKLDVEYIGLTGGNVGLSMATFEEAPVIISFDWVKVSEP